MYHSFQGDTILFEAQNRFGYCNATTAISDTTGRLLLYTDNETIWNSNHQIIANGSNFRGCRFFTQGGLFVPFNSNPNKFFYIYPDTRRDNPNIVNGYPFVCLDVFPNNGRLWLSVIDITANNGVGAVMEKDRAIYGSGDIVGVLAATKHANNKDTWLLTVDTLKKQVVALLLTDCGIKDTVYSVPYPYNAIGQYMDIIFAPNGEKFCIPNYKGDGNSFSTFSSIYGFDNINGNMIHLYTLNRIYIGYDKFSSDAKYFFSREQWTAGLFRFDLSSNDSTTIMQSKLNLGGLGNTIQTYNLLNGNMYDIPIFASPVSMYNIISNLNSNTPTLTSYNFLRPDYKYQARPKPNFISNYFDPTFKEYVYGQVQVKHNRVCVGGETYFKASQLPPATPYHWEIYEGNTLVKTVYNQDSVTHTFSKAGNYVTKLWVDFTCIPDSVVLRDVIVDSFPIDYLHDTYLCEGTTIKAQPNQVSYFWNTNSTSNTISIIPNESYWVEVTNTCGTYKDEFNTIKVDYTGTNLVTANYDQLNDQLVIDNNSPFKGKIKIYSIWGDCVFQSNQYQVVFKKVCISNKRFNNFLSKES